MLCYILSCCWRRPGRFSLSVKGSLAGAVPAGAVSACAVCSGIVSVLRRAISAFKASIVAASSLVRGRSSTCTGFGVSFEFPNLYLRHPRCNFPSIDTVTLMRGSESAKTRASWNARLSSLCSFSLLDCHDLWQRIWISRYSKD